MSVEETREQGEVIATLYDQHGPLKVWPPRPTGVVRVQGNGHTFLLDVDGHELVSGRRP